MNEVAIYVKRAETPFIVMMTEEQIDSMLEQIVVKWQKIVEIRHGIDGDEGYKLLYIVLKCIVQIMVGENTIYYALK